MCTWLYMGVWNCFNGNFSRFYSYHSRSNSPEDTYTLKRTRVNFSVLFFPSPFAEFFSSSTLSIKILFCSFFFVIPKIHISVGLCASLFFYSFFRHLFRRSQIARNCSNWNREKKCSNVVCTLKWFWFLFFSEKKVDGMMQSTTHYTTHWAVEKWIFV